MYDADNIAVMLPPVLEHSIRSAFDDDDIDRILDHIKHQRPTLREIREAVCELYCLENFVLTQPSRVLEVARARQIFCYLAYRYTGFSMHVVGKQVCLNDHTSVRNAVHKIERVAMQSAVLADDLDLLRLRISEKILLRCKGRA